MRLTKILLPLFVGFIITAQGFAAELTSMHKILPEYREKAATFLFHMENEADVEAFMKAPVQSFPNITPEVIHADNVELRIYRPKIQKAVPPCLLFTILTVVDICCVALITICLNTK